MKDYYKILGVNPDVSVVDLKRVYRKLSLRFHPDRNPDNPEAESKFKEISEAYSVLSDQTKRKQYDNQRRFGGLFFGSVFERGGRPKPDLNTPRNGEDIIIGVKLPLSLFIFGGEFATSISYEEGCTSCGGKGFSVGEECSFCQGYGTIERVHRTHTLSTVQRGLCPKCKGMGQVVKDECTKCSGSGRVYVKDKEFVFDISEGVSLGDIIVCSKDLGRTGLNGGRSGYVFIKVVGVSFPTASLLKEEHRESLKKLIKEIESADKSP